LGSREDIILLVLSRKEPRKILIFFSIKSELFKRLWRRQSNYDDDDDDYDDDDDGGGGGDDDDNKGYPAQYLTIIRQCI